MTQCPRGPVHLPVRHRGEAASWSGSPGQDGLVELPADAGVGDPTTLPPGQRALPVEDNPEILRRLVDLLRETPAW